MSKQSFLKAITLMIMIGLISLVAACGNNENTSGQAKETGGIVPVYTPPSGGINYVISAGLGDILNKSESVGSKYSVEATPGASDMIIRMMENYDQGISAIAAPAYESAYKIYNGESEVLDGEYSQLRAIGYLAETSLHIVVREDSPIESFSDLKGKRVGTAQPGDTMYYFIRDLLEEQYDLSEEDYEGIPLSYSEVQDGIKNGSVDAGLIMGMPPAPAVVELAQTEDIRILSVESDKMEDFLEDRPYYSSVTVEPGTYPNQDEEILIGTFSSIYVTHGRTSDEEVYAFLQSIFDHPEDLKQVHPTFNITKENVAADIEIPFHSGAIEFFEDNEIEYK